MSSLNLLPKSRPSYALLPATPASTILLAPHTMAGFSLLQLWRDNDEESDSEEEDGEEEDGQA